MKTAGTRLTDDELQNIIGMEHDCDVVRESQRRYPSMLQAVAELVFDLTDLGRAVVGTLGEKFTNKLPESSPPPVMTWPAGLELVKVYSPEGRHMEPTDDALPDVPGSGSWGKKVYRRLPPGCRGDLMTEVQARFRVVALELVGDLERLEITDIKVGRNSQMVSASPIRASFYAHRSWSSSRNLSLDECGPATFITVSIRNTSNEPAEVYGHIVGNSVLSF